MKNSDFDRPKTVILKGGPSSLFRQKTRGTPVLRKVRSPGLDDLFFSKVQSDQNSPIYPRVS